MNVKVSIIGTRIKLKMITMRCEMCEVKEACSYLFATGSKDIRDDKVDFSV